MGTLKSRTHKRRVFVYYVLYCFSHSHLQINFPRIHMKIPYRRRKLHMSKSHLVVRKTKVNTTRCCCCCSLELRFWKPSEGYVCFDVLRLRVLFLERILSLITLNQTVSAEPVGKNLSFFVLSCHIGLVWVGRRTIFFYISASSFSVWYKWKTLQTLFLFLFLILMS